MLERNARGAGHAVGRKLSYVDLSLFQVMAGLRYAFPKTMQAQAHGHPGLAALHDKVAELPRIAAYLKSKRRQAFNTSGIFRHYPELDRPTTGAKRRAS